MLTPEGASGAGVNGGQSSIGGGSGAAAGGPGSGGASGGSSNLGGSPGSGGAAPTGSGGTPTPEGGVDGGTTDGSVNGGGQNAGGTPGSGGAGSGGRPSMGCMMDSGGQGRMCGPDPKPTVSCGSTTCNVAAGEKCCGGSLASLAFSCTANTQGCVLAVGCDSDGDCGPGAVCCATTSTNTLYGMKCQTTPCTTPFMCSQPSDCGTGSVCCGEYASFAGSNVYTASRCSATCTGLGKTVLCDEKTVCPQGKKCQPSLSLQPGFTDCR